uniref:Uncharacterized protein n=1 Tax=Arundo donax TaxID=35708 RepID=A0A0A9FHT2_ARUDO
MTGARERKSYGFKPDSTTRSTKPDARRA